MMQSTEGISRPRIVVHVDPDLEDIIPVFLESRHEDVKAMHEALERQDYGTIRISGHNMKRSGGGFGFGRITEIGRCLEQAAKDEDAEEVRKLIEVLSRYLVDVEVIVE